ncbi:hypothetical protein, partial [Corynebacterium simulans]|uniref:hypothetical protein n=1 Tax=Corynebacterium simulans TaxID=146827 RepID=UPI002003B085
PKPNKQTNQPNTHHNECSIRLANPKNYYTKKNHNHPQPDGAKIKGAVKPQKCSQHDLKMHTK